MEQPPSIESTSIPPVLEKKRYHDLDALRAGAMLLGIVLHAILAFGQPGWPGYAPQNDAHWVVPTVVSNAADVVGTEAPKKFSPYNFCFTAIHGFRMQLFFVVSGFFTAMLWSTRGTKELLKHRAKRILLPLAIFTPIAWITMLGGMGIGTLGASVLFGNEGDSKGDAMRAAVEKGPDASIRAAVLHGDIEAVKKHLSKGADFQERNEKGETLLHTAAFFAHPEIVQLLLDKGLDPTIKNQKGKTPLNQVEDPWNGVIEGIYKLVGGLMRMELDLERIKRDRPKCAAILRNHTSSGTRSPPAADLEPEGPLKKFKYRVYYQQFNTLPDFDKLTPEFSRESEKGIIDLGLARKKEGFGMVFEGELEIPKAGEFTFLLGSDDGSRLFINDEELIDNDGTHGMEYKERSVKLEPGMAKIRVDYFDWGGAQSLSLWISGPGVDKMELSKSARADRSEGKGDFNEMVMKQLPEWLQAIVGIGAIAAMAPIFHHLWFLYYLVWMVLGFALVVWLAKKWNIKQWSAWIVASPLRWLWLVPITLVPQLLMGQSFGPDIAGGILPWPPVLLYYGIFFGVGALCYSHDEFEQKVGKFWPISFLLAIPVLILGMCFMQVRNTGATLDFEANAAQIWRSHFWVSVCVVFYAWLMIFGCIGFFRTFFSGKSKVARYISDSSYWLYLAHLAPLMCLQMMLAKWEIPGLFKFIFYCVFTTAILLVMYEFLVRYTFIGTLLNGKRTRDPVKAEPAKA